MKKKFFTRTKENFTCEVCGEKVTGNGYTNHCPKCLHSKHVDVYPGDRQEVCGGIMDIVDMDLKNDQYIFTHACRTCGYKKRNKQSSEDDIPAIIATSKKLRRIKNTE